MKKIYISEDQKKHLKKAIAAQDQVGGKVNAGIMDAVAGGAMCEDKLNETTDCFGSESYTKSDSITFITPLEGNGMKVYSSKKRGIRHQEIINDLIKSGNIEYFYFDSKNCPAINPYMTGRYWVNSNTISLYKTPVKKSDRALTKNAVEQLGLDQNTLDVDFWDTNRQLNIRSQFVLPFKWFFNGTIDDLIDMGVYLITKRSYGLYQASFDNFKTYLFDRDGNIVNKDLQESFNHQSNDGKTIGLYHGVNFNKLEHNLESGGFSPRVCSEGGPKAIWMSEKMYGYPFIFKFDMPRDQVEQLSNVDYIYCKPMSFNDFNCRLAKASFLVHYDGFVVNVDLLNTELLDRQLRMLPDLPNTISEMFEKYPLVYQKYVKPVLDGKKLNESINHKLNYSIWYRGYDGTYGSDRGEANLLWLTDDLEYAKEYAMEIPNRTPGHVGVVKKYVIDFDQCNGSIYDLPEDVDYYDGPDEQLQQELLAQGINSYCFYANDDSSYCMCLWGDVVPELGKPEIVFRTDAMNEDVDTQKYKIGFEKGGFEPCGHVLNETPDSVYNFDAGWRDDDCIAFLYSKKDDDLLVGRGTTHHRLIIDDGGSPDDDENYGDTEMRGRYWSDRNLISFWQTPSPDKLRFVVERLKKHFYTLNIDTKTLIVDVWDWGGFDWEVPYQWFFDGFLDDLSDKILRINLEDEEKFTFRVELKQGGVYYCGLDGVLKPQQSEYAAVVESRKKVIKNDEGKVVPEKCDKCGEDVVLQIHGEPVYVCKKCGKYFGTMPFPKNLNENHEWCDNFEYTPYLKSIAKFLQENGINVTPFPHVKMHRKEQEGLYVKTGYYDPDERCVHLFIADRHPKDVLRSFTHEMIHHNQNLRGILVGYKGDTLDGDEVLDKLESEAYLKGNIYFRRWTEELHPEIPTGTVKKKTRLNEYVEHNTLTLYRGYNKDFGIQKTNLLWLTTSLRYAASYGNSVVEYKINESQLKIFDGWDLENPYDGLTANEEKRLKKMGFNAYAFEASNDAETYVLFDQTLINSLHPRVMGKPEVKEKLGLLNESIQDIYNMQEDWDEFGVSSLLSEFFRDKKRGITKKQWDLIPAQQYQNLLTRYMQDPITARIPDNVVYDWFENVVKNAFDIEYITELAGHSQWFPADEVQEELDAWVGEKYQITDYVSGYEALEAEGFYEWCSLPDGSDGWSDYGLEPIFKELSYYKPNMPAGDLLILINRVLHIGHCRGDLASAFIEGGSQSCSAISGIIRESIEETKWNGNGEEWKGLEPVQNPPAVLYHASPKYNRKSIMELGLYPDCGEEYKDWWNYEGPNGEYPDDEELPEMVFLSDKPYTWYKNISQNGETDIYQIDVSKLDLGNLFYDPDRYQRNNGAYCYSNVIPPSALKLYGQNIEENFDIDELSTPDSIDLSSFDIKDQLNPRFWKNGRIDSRVRTALLDIADDFIDYLDVPWTEPKDIIITGSLANYNWSQEHSDVDLHIVINFKDVDDNVKLVKEYFDSKRRLWNEEHQNITIAGFQVELYVQDEHEPHASTGVYSLDKDKWLVRPDIRKFDLDYDKSEVKEKVAEYMNKIDDLYDEYEDSVADCDLSELHEKAEKLFDDIKNERRNGFEQGGGEYNVGNLIFKSLRRNGYIGKLDKIKTDSYDLIKSVYNEG